MDSEIAPLLLEIQERGEWQDNAIGFSFQHVGSDCHGQKEFFFGMQIFLYSLLFDALKDAANPQVVVSV